MKLIKIFTVLALLLVLNLHARELVNVNFSDMKINDFIKLVAKITNKNILINYNVNGTVDFVSSAPIYDDEVMEILISVLETKGYTIIQNGNIYEIVRSSEAAKHNAKVLEPWQKAKGSILVTQTLPLKYENADVVASKIRHIMSMNAKLVTMRESNTILLTDYPENIETIKEVINDLEYRRHIIVEIVPLQYAEGKQLLATLKEVYKSKYNEKVETEKVTLLYNANKNAIIFAGKKDNVNYLINLLTELDVPEDLDSTTRIIELKNSDAKKVLATLNDIANKQKFTDPSLKPNISISESINAVIMIGNAAILKAFEKIITQLDKEKYQVYIQARIIEVNNGASEQIGFKWGVGGAVTTPDALYTLGANLGGDSVVSPGTTGVTQASILSMIDIANLKDLLLVGLAVDFLEQENAAKTLSSPTILCSNNQESTIKVGQKQNFISGSITNNAGIASQANSYKQEFIGLTLKVKPMVSSKEKVTIDMESILSSVLAEKQSTQIPNPVIGEQNVNTRAILRHGETIIVGGLVNTSESVVESKVPILGDIPGLGVLFRHKLDKIDKRTIMVIITPFVIDNSESLIDLQHTLGDISKIQYDLNKKVIPKVEEINEDKGSGIPDRPNTADMILK